MSRSDFPKDVQAAIVQLSDELCVHERFTGVTSVLVVRMSSGAEYRAANGKPGVPDDVSDESLFNSEECAEPAR